VALTAVLEAAAGGPQGLLAAALGMVGVLQVTGRAAEQPT